MSRDFKIFLIVLISCSFWWGANVFAQRLGDFFYAKEALKSEQLLAQVNNYEQQLAKSRPVRIVDAEELNITARSATSMLIKRDGEEKILFEKNIDEKLPIASVTKLMTALISVQNYDLSQIAEISQAAGEMENEYGNGNLKVSEKFSVKNLLHFLLIESNNGSALTLAEIMGENEFIDLMNIKAVELGLENTFFVNPTGLDPEIESELTNYSTVKDIAKLAIRILKEEPSIWGITQKKEFDVYSSDGILFRKISNTNELLGIEPNLSGKTGWTPRAGGCLIVVYWAPDKSSHIVNVVLSSEDRFGDMRKMVDWLKASYEW